MTAVRVEARVNGQAWSGEVEPRLLLSDFLRRDLGLTGIHVGCEHGVCGACTVHLDGEPVRACLLFAVQIDGHEVTTVEGLSPGAAFRDVPGGAGSAGGEAGEGGAERLAGEGLAAGAAAGEAAELDALHPLQRAFSETHALQCGFCTPGILMTAAAFLEEVPRPTRDEIREAISGHLCRCTGYHNIVEAVALAAERLVEERP